MILGSVALGYLFIGVLLWLVIDGLGIIRESVATRSAHGRPVSGEALAIATVCMIVGWPVFVFAFVRGAVK